MRSADPLAERKLLEHFAGLNRLMDDCQSAEGIRKEGLACEHAPRPRSLISRWAGAFDRRLEERLLPGPLLHGEGNTPPKPEDSQLALTIFGA